MSSYLVQPLKIDLPLMDQTSISEVLVTQSNSSCNGVLKSSPNSLAVMPLPNVEVVSDQTSVLSKRGSELSNVDSDLKTISRPDLSLSNSSLQDKILPNHHNYCDPQSNLHPRDEIDHAAVVYARKSMDTKAEDSLLSNVWKSEISSVNMNGLTRTPGFALTATNNSEAPDSSSSVRENAEKIEQCSLTSELKDTELLLDAPSLSTSRGAASENILNTGEGETLRHSVEDETPHNFSDVQKLEKPHSPRKADDNKQPVRSDVTCKKQSTKVPRSASPPQVPRCGLCGKYYRHAASLRNHMRKHASGALASKRYRCPHCVYSSQYKRNVLKHIDSIHQNTNPFFPTNPSVANDPSYPDRNAPNRSNQSYWSSQNMNGNPYKVVESGTTNYSNTNQCYYKQQTAADNYGTFDSVHNPLPSMENTPREAYRNMTVECLPTDQESSSSQTYVCSAVGCGKQFKSLKLLTAHANDCHHEVLFKCPMDGCQFVGQKQENLKRHMNQYHLERKNSLQELLTQDRNDYSQQMTSIYGKNQSATTTCMEFYSSNVRTKPSVPCKRQMMDIPFPGDTWGGSQHPMSYAHHNPSEPFQRFGPDVYSFPGSSSNQSNDANSQFPQVAKFGDGSIDQSAYQRCENGSDLYQQSCLQNPLGSVNAFRSSMHSANISVPRAPSSCMMRSDSPGSYKTFEPSAVDCVHFYENGVTQELKTVEDWMPDQRTSTDKQTIAIRSEPRLRSTVEQLLCAPDPTSTSLDQFFRGPPEIDFVASGDFRSVSRDNPTNGFVDGLGGATELRSKQNEVIPVEFGSPHNINELGEGLTGLSGQKQVNSETDAFFTDLQEILARDMLSPDNCAPKTTEWSNTNPASVGTKEEVLRFGDSTQTKSPFTTRSAKPICTASLMSGDSGLESWSSSSSCSAGPNGSSVWGPQEGNCNAKSSPCASTPQPASIPCQGLQDSNILNTYEGYLDGQPLDDPALSTVSNNEFRGVPNLSRTPSRNYEDTADGNSVSFMPHLLSRNGRSVLSPTIQRTHSGMKTAPALDDRASNLAHLVDDAPPHSSAASCSFISNAQDVPCDQNRLEFTNELSFPYRSAGIMSDSRAQQVGQTDQTPTAMNMGNFADNQTIKYQHTQNPSQRIQRVAPSEGSTISDQTVVPGALSANLNPHFHGSSRVRPQLYTSLDRQQSLPPPALGQQQEQQQYYAKTNPCPVFEQNSYRSINYSRSIVPPGQSGIDDSNALPQNNYANPTQHSVEHHSFAPCDANCVVESGGTATRFAAEQSTDAELKLMNHVNPGFATSRANSYGCTDGPNTVVCPDPASHPCGNARYTWSSGYPVPVYQTYQQQQQQSQQTIMHQGQHPYRVYYNGDPMQSGQTGMMYSMDQAGLHSVYARQPSMTGCDSQLFMPQSQPQLVHNSNVPPSYPHFGSQIATQHMNSHPGQRFPQLSHLHARQSHAAQMQGTPRHAILQSHQPAAPYTNRIPVVTDTSEVYPSTAGSELNPIWPPADACSFTPDPSSLAPPNIQSARNGPRQGTLPPTAANMHPGDSSSCSAPGPEAVGASYNPEFVQVNRLPVDSDPTRIPVSCATGLGTNGSSVTVRSVQPHWSHPGQHPPEQTQQQQQQQLGQNPLTSSQVTSQVPEGFDNNVPVCAIATNR